MGEEADVSVVLHLVGGPADGERVAVRERPLAWNVAVAKPLRILEAEPLAPFESSVEVWRYEPVIGAFGHLSRGDDGAYRFECRGRRDG